MNNLFKEGQNFLLENNHFKAEFIKTMNYTIEDKNKDQKDKKISDCKDRDNLSKDNYKYGQRSNQNQLKEHIKHHSNSNQRPARTKAW